MKRSHIINLIVILVGLSPLGFLLISWEAIPENFTTKFDFNKLIEKVQTRQELLVAVIILSAVSILMYLLMCNIGRIDPKVKKSTPRSAFYKIGIALTLFLTGVNYLIILSPKYEWIIDVRVMLAGFGVLMAILGNYMNNLKPNYFAGIRLPWTLNDADNWRRTHLLAGKLWFAGGIILVIGCFIFAKSILLPFAGATLLLLVVIPGVYSYRLYRNKLN